MLSWKRFFLPLLEKLQIRSFNQVCLSHVSYVSSAHQRRFLDATVEFDEDRNVVLVYLYHRASTYGCVQESRLPTFRLASVGAGAHF
jgi:hypothetical protein